MDQFNLDAMFDNMLGELDIISQQLEDSSEPAKSSPKSEESEKRSSGYSQISSDASSSQSYSKAPPSVSVTEDVAEDIDLNAMLSDLTDWEHNLTSGQGQMPAMKSASQDSGIGFNGNSLPRKANLTAQYGMEGSPQFNTLKRSAAGGPSVTFGDDDDMSLASLEKDIELDKREQDKSRQLTTEELAALSPEEREERMKAEKMRIALEKLKEARIQKLMVKVYNKDDSSKTLVVDERMTTRSVVRQLLEKNHYEPSINWAVIEELPSLFMERIFEEHEQVTEMLSYWTRDTTNQVRFLERKDKYALFRNPQHYLLTTTDSEGQMAERQKQTLVEEFFSGRSGTGVPEVQGILYLKGDSKSWSRKYCVLRTSGLYCSKSGEPKKGKKVSDLQCLVMFEQVCVYLGRGWKKKHKSPTDYGFALKHPAIQTKSKHIKYFCCEDVRSLMRWIVGIRCAKYGKQLKDNYDKTCEEMKASTPVSGLPFQAQQSDATSTVSTDSGEAGSRQNTLPRANLSNVFEGAWQRASQQEESGSEGPPVQRAKSVWKPQQAKTNSNWWDLSDQGHAQNNEDGSETTTISNRTSGTSNIGSVVSNNRMSVSSTGSRGSYKESSTPTFVPLSPTNFASQQEHMDFMPPPPDASPTVSHPPPPPMMMNMPPAHHNHVPPPAPFVTKSAPPPPAMKPGHPPPLFNKPSPPPMNMMAPRNRGPPPPLASNKPFHYATKGPPPPPMAAKPTLPAHGSYMAPPPPPMEDMPPPPPESSYMPPPPPMEDLPPPPPIDDDMPLPPPMDVTPNPGLPKGLRSVNGQQPVRLPMLPMFKNGGFSGNQAPHPRGPKPGMFPPTGPKPGPPPKNISYPPPPPHKNYNYSNNKPPLLPRDEIAHNHLPQGKSRTPSYSNHSVQRKPSNPRYQPPGSVSHGNHSQHFAQAPLTQYYSNTQTARNVSYKKDDFPPPPEFILDLKDTFHQVSYNDSMTRDVAELDLPPPPPELLLNEVMNRRQPPPPKSSKPPPPPPKRSPSTKLSFKRR